MVKQIVGADTTTGELPVVVETRIAATIDAAVLVETGARETADADLQTQINDIESGDVDSVAGLTGIVAADDLKTALNLPSDTNAALAAEATLARDADNLTSGTVDDARLPARLSDAELASVFAAQLDGTGKTLAELNTWLAVPSPLGIKRLTGTINLAGSLVMNTANTILDVAGTTLNTIGDYPAITSVNAQAIVIQNCKIVNTFTGTRTTYDIDITNPTKPNLVNVEVNLTNGSLTMGGVRIRYDSGQAGNNFMPILDSVWIRNGHLVLDGVTDGKADKTFVWAPNTGSTLGAIQMVNAANGWTFTACDVIPPIGDTPAGFYMNGCAHNRIVGGYADGNNAGIMTGNGATLVNCLRVSFTGFGFWNLGRSGLVLNGSIGTLVTGCTFSKNNKVDNFWPDLSLTGSSATSVVGNTFSSLDARTNKGAIYVEDATSSDNLFDLNTVEWHSGVQFYASPFIVMQGTSTQGVHNKPETAFSYAKTKSITATYGVPKEDLFQGNSLMCSGTFTVTLPTTASLHSGDTIAIKNVGAGVITIATSSSQVIDGGPTSVALVAGHAVTLLSQGGLGWRMISTSLGLDPAVGGDLTGTVSNAQIAGGAVGATELAADAVTDVKVAAGAAIAQSKIANLTTDLAAQQVAIDAKVADAINDGTTTVAPSQNAVFDALALKAPLAGTTVVPTFSFPSGTYIVPIVRTTLLAASAAFMRVAPFFVPQTLTIVRIGGEITTIGDVGSKLRLGIYADNGAGKPGAIVVDAGQIAGDSATVQEITLGSSLVLTRGWYWAGGAPQSVTVTAPTVRSVDSIGPVGSSGGGFLFDLGTSIPAANISPCGYLMSSVTGALPGTFTNGGQTGTAPRLFFKLA